MSDNVKALIAEARARVGEWGSRESLTSDVRLVARLTDALEAVVRVPSDVAKQSSDRKALFNALEEALDPVEFELARYGALGTLIYRAVDAVLAAGFRRSPEPQQVSTDGGVGWYEWIHPVSATTHVAYVHENGKVYGFEHGWNPDAFVLAKARGRVYRLVRVPDTEGSAE